MKAVLVGLLICAGSAFAQEPQLKALTLAKGEWEWCVMSTYHQLGPPNVDDAELVRRSERAFAACQAEEDYLLSFIDLALSENGRRQGRFLHFKDKIAMKTKLTDETFRALADALSKKP